MKSQNKLTDTDSGMVVTRRKGRWQGGEQGQGVKCVVTGGDKASGGELTTQHTGDGR